MLSAFSTLSVHSAQSPFVSTEECESLKAFHFLKKAPNQPENIETFQEITGPSGTVFFSKHYSKRSK